MAPRTVFTDPQFLSLLSAAERGAYTTKYNWVMAMQPFKAGRTWPQVLMDYDNYFPLSHLDSRSYGNFNSIRDRLSDLRKELTRLEEKHDLRAAQLLLDFSHGN
ncbi:hypothetical protein DID88_000403 [Monilinia fructigena]|uniref:Uncharacterized protein n=1 Tax=Monilinia fructigena TaxID=38457 RepID=A0A395IIQ3_9HELO|nr:hypothetical protein DID88_000403 [Monilinia fructigena]